MRTFLTMSTILAVLGSAVPALGDGEPGEGALGPPQPLDLGEITATLERPLSLDDCIRIALSGNIALRVVVAERGKARAAHS